MGFWRKLFGENNPRQETSHETKTDALQDNSSVKKQILKECAVCGNEFDAYVTVCPNCGDSTNIMSGGTELLEIVEAQNQSVKYNDEAVALLRDGKTAEAINKVQKSIEANPKHATAHSNLGYMLVKTGQIDQGVASLFRAIEINPNHSDARQHLYDTLGQYIDELVEIGFKKGFLSKNAGGDFDEDCNNIRARAIGQIVAKMGEKGTFQTNDKKLSTTELMSLVINEVTKSMNYESAASGLKFAWKNIGGWYP